MNPLPSTAWIDIRVASHGKRSLVIRTDGCFPHFPLVTPGMMYGAAVG